MSDKLSKEILDAHLNHGIGRHKITHAANAYYARILSAMDAWGKQEVLAMLKWLLTPNDDYKISSGEGCFYFNGVEKSFPEMYELYLQYKANLK